MRMARIQGLVGRPGRVVGLLALALLVVGAYLAGDVASAHAALLGPAGLSGAGLSPAEGGVSDQELVTAIWLPIVFVVPTILIVAWAVRNRTRSGDPEEELPWWRTEQWYTGREDEADASRE